MQKRHTDPLQYLNEQIISTQKYVVPFIQELKPIVAGMQVLEIGCGEAGNLKPFVDMGCICTGLTVLTRYGALSESQQCLFQPDCH